MTSKRQFYLEFQVLIQKNVCMWKQNLNEWFYNQLPIPWKGSKGDLFSKSTSNAEPDIFSRKPMQKNWKTFV